MYLLFRVRITFVGHTMPGGGLSFYRAYTAIEGV